MKNKKNVSELDTKNEATEAVNNTENITEAAEKGAETKDAAQSTEQTKHEGITSFVYAGPSIPNGRLKKYTILNGTYAEITKHYKDVIKEYPNIARLIVPSMRFAETRDKTQTSGNVLYKWYQEIDAAIKAKGDAK